MYAEVLIEYSNKAIDKTFTYIIPSNLLSSLKVGMKVKVPFNNRLVNGFVLKIINEYTGTYELKTIASITDIHLILDEELLLLGNYLQEKTLCSKITAYQTMLPSSLKIKDQKHSYLKYNTYLELNESIPCLEEYIKNHPRRTSHATLLKSLISNNHQLKNNFSLPTTKALLELNLIKEVKEQVYRLKAKPINEEELPSLTLDQQNVIQNIKLNSSETYLLHGVTGSGKTEVYMRLIATCLQNKKTAIMLLPEISLTTQMIERFYNRFGSHVAIFHSALSDGEKYDEYQKIYRGEIDIVVGTRSAIFTPLKNLGLIILDEEHSENYHQDTNPRYSALDMALFRSNYHHCPVILGSATPTLESMARALKGVYHLLKIPRRIGHAILPQINIVDMASEAKKRNMIISESLKNAINIRLSNHEQIILLLNRRGFSTTISCSACGYTFKCPHCDITLTYHKTSNNLRCHYCGYTILKPKSCPECHEDALNFLGLGTEKLEQTLNTMFPQANIVRMDVDTTTNKGSHEKIITAFKNHEYDILLGTQMISKGLDFPLVTLVGVINADSSLNIPDFRSGERTFALLSQVSGRAGRSDLPGEVIIQTYNPDNFYLNCVKENDYQKFFEHEMQFRRQLKYPPYYYIANIEISSSDYDTSSHEATKVFNYLKSNLDSTTQIFGPTTAPIFKLNNLYRFQIMLKYRFDNKLPKVLKDIDTLYAPNPKVNFNIDLNPNHS